MLWWEGLHKSLNSPVFCMKVDFMQLEKGSFQIQSFERQVLFPCLFLSSSDWLSVLPIFSGRARLGWEVAPRRVEIWESFEHGKLFDTSEAAARRKIWSMDYRNSRKGSFDFCRQRIRVPNSLKGRLARQNPARCCQRIPARLTWLLSLLGYANTLNTSAVNLLPGNVLLRKYFYKKSSVQLEKLVLNRSTNKVDRELVCRRSTASKELNKDFCQR